MPVAIIADYEWLSDKCIIRDGKEYILHENNEYEVIGKFKSPSRQYLQEDGLTMYELVYDASYFVNMAALFETDLSTLLNGNYTIDAKEKSMEFLNDFKTLAGKINPDISIDLEEVEVVIPVNNTQRLLRAINYEDSVQITTICFIISFLILLNIDEEFQSVYKLKCAKGRLFSANDFKDTGNEIPLLLGYDFQKYYNLDDKIYDDGGQCYRVVGFLEKSSFYINPLRGEEISWLNRAFIIPLQPDKFEEWDYNSAIYSTFIITDDPENLRAIQEKSNELNLYTFEFRSFTEQLQMRLEGYHYSILIIGFITAAILFFAVTGFILNLIQFIKTHTKEFENHLLSGGRIMPIILRILIQVFIIIFLSGIIVAVIHKLLEIIAVPYFYRPTPVTLLTILASLLIGLVIVIYPMVMLSRIQKNSILKRSQ